MAARRSWVGSDEALLDHSFFHRQRQIAGRARRRGRVASGAGRSPRTAATKAPMLAPRPSRPAGGLGEVGAERERRGVGEGAGQEIHPHLAGRIDDPHGPLAGLGDAGGAEAGDEAVLELRPPHRPGPACGWRRRRRRPRRVIGSSGVSASARSRSWIIRSSTTETSRLRGLGRPTRTASSSSGRSGMSNRPMAASPARSRKPQAATRPFASARSTMRAASSGDGRHRLFDIDRLAGRQRRQRRRGVVDRRRGDRDDVDRGDQLGFAGEHLAAVLGRQGLGVDRRGGRRPRRGSRPAGRRTCPRGSRRKRPRRSPRRAGPDPSGSFTRFRGPPSTRRSRAASDGVLRFVSWRARPSSTVMADRKCRPPNRTLSSPWPRLARPIRLPAFMGRRD